MTSTPTSHPTPPATGYTTLMTPTQLMALQASPTPPLVFDCSFDLMKPSAGDALHAEARIPGAVYMHLDRDLSAGADDAAASGGRHPLPSREAFAQRLRQRGLRAGQQVVVYDRQGAQYCGRLWWMLRWCGHAHVAVLDGGLPAWQAAGGAVAHGEPSPTPLPVGDFALQAPLVAVRSAQQLVQHLGHPQQCVVDARAAARYRGEVEPLDPVAGHIPGARNRPFADNFLPDGRFKPAEQLRAEWLNVLGPHQPAHVVHHCGSGITAIPNLLAMEIAGLGSTALFPGSWSEWCNTPGMPCAQG